MRHLVIVLCLLLASCSAVIKPQPIIPDQQIRGKIRVAYQKGLEHKLETRLHFAEALLELEKELNIRLDVVAETEFEYTPIQFPEGVPAGLIQDLNVMTKGGTCGALHIPDGASTICIFEGTITPKLGEDDGIVLGAQNGPIIILSNLKSRFLFINVVRHEIGHLLGAPHSKKLMAPSVPKGGDKRLIPFPEEAIISIRKRFGQ